MASYNYYEVDSNSVVFGPETAQRLKDIATRYTEYVDFKFRSIIISAEKCDFCVCDEAFYRIYSNSNSNVTKKCCGVCVYAFKNDINQY